MIADPQLNFYSHDVEAGVAFYRDHFGFTETFRTPRDEEPTHVELKLDGFTIGVSSVEAARLRHGVDPTPGKPAMVLVLWTDDLDTFYGRLTAAGVAAVQPPHDTSNNNRTAMLRDPDGNLVELVAKRSLGSC